MKRSLVWSIVLAIAVGAAAALYGSSRFAPVDALEPSSVATVAFVNHGEPLQPVGELHPDEDPMSPLLTCYWQDEATLERALLTVLEDAQRRRLDGSRRVTGNGATARRGALDLVFASNHSLRVVEPGPEGERVGRIVVDRTRPSVGRAGMLAVTERLTKSHAGKFPDVRIYNVFLLNCGSHEDASDHRRLQDFCRALTGSPPAHILTTSGKVTPAPRHIRAGYATGEALMIYDSLPAETGDPVAVPFLRVAGGGHFDFVMGAGEGIERPPTVTLKTE